MHKNQQFAKQVKATRARLGLSQAGAALVWRVNINTLQDWEQGRRLPRGATLLRLLPILSAPGKPRGPLRP